MPELPEVETIARTLRPQIEGKRISALELLLTRSLQGETELFSRIRGCKIDRVLRRAKLLLLFLSTADAPAHAGEKTEKNGGEPSLVLAFHLKMTGGFCILPEGTPPQKHTRIIFDLEQGGHPATRLFFNDIRTFGFCRVMRPGELNAWPFWRALGPEPLEGEAEALAAHLALSFRQRRGAVKAALLDQSLIAGIGNIYADESLFRAGIRPDVPAGSISEAKLLKLAKAIQDILLLSIQECGSSIRDYKDANGKAGAFQNSFAVYGRKGLPCPLCGQTLESARIAGRSTVFCADCQQ